MGPGQGPLGEGQLDRPSWPAEGVQEGQETPLKSVFWAAESGVKNGCGEPEGQFDLQITIDS